MDGYGLAGPAGRLVAPGRPTWGSNGRKVSMDGYLTGTDHPDGDAGSGIRGPVSKPQWRRRGGGQ